MKNTVLKCLFVIILSLSSTCNNKKTDKEISNYDNEKTTEGGGDLKKEQQEVKKPLDEAQKNLTGNNLSRTIENLEEALWEAKDLKIKEEIDQKQEVLKRDITSLANTFETSSSSFQLHKQQFNSIKQNMARFLDLLTQSLALEDSNDNIIALFKSRFDEAKKDISSISDISSTDYFGAYSEKYADYSGNPTSIKALISALYKFETQYLMSTEEDLNIMSEPFKNLDLYKKQIDFMREQLQEIRLSFYNNIKSREYQDYIYQALLNDGNHIDVDQYYKSNIFK